MGNLLRYFQRFSRTYKQNLRTFQDSTKNPGLFQDVATLRTIQRIGCCNNYLSKTLKGGSDR